MKLIAVVLLVLLSAMPAAGGMWDSIKKGASDTANAVGDAARTGAHAVRDAASDAGEAVTDAVSPDQSRGEIDTMAARTLKHLFADTPIAERLYDQSFGYAVFDSRKMSFVITTAFGAGVAVERAAGKRTYMKMATGGVNVGMGVQWYQVVFLFETRTRFRQFVNEGWDAGGSGSLAAADAGANLGATFQNGLAVFQITEKGLMASADLTGTKYWKNDELNPQ